MQQYIVEMHYHTSEVSACAHVAAAESVKVIQNAGYDAVVVTDHYTPEFFAPLRDLSWSQQIDRYLAGYRSARLAAADLPFDVHLGMEIRFSENNNDYLVYGLTEDFLLQHPDLYQMGIHAFAKLCRKKGLLVYQAHPFRNRMTVTRPHVLFGIEGINANPRHDSRNDIAQAWAEKYDLPMIAGSDYHQRGDEGGSGLVFAKRLSSSEAFVQALRQQEYQFCQADLCLAHPQKHS